MELNLSDNNIENNINNNIINNNNKEQQQQEEEQEEKQNLITFQIITQYGQIIILNSVNLMENTSFLKQNLSELFETCGYTSYNFEFKNLETNEILILSDYAELNAYFSEYVGQTITLNMVSQPYDAKSSRIHVKKTREILAYPPQVKGVSTSTKEATQKESPAPTTTNTNANENNNNNDENNNKVNEESTSSPETVDVIPQEPKEKTLKEMKAEIERVKAALPTDGEIFIPHNVSLKEYYQEVLYRVSENPDIQPTSSSPADAIKSIFFSGWNPPSPQRKLHGDLYYLEVQFSNPSTPSLFITAQSHGFYVNKSTSTTFDPTPASSANFSHELLYTIKASNSQVSHAWNEVSKKIDEQSKKMLEEVEEDLVNSKANALEPVAALYAQGRGDLVAQVPEWTSRPLDGTRKNKNSTYDMSRAQDDLCDNFGIEEKGALREWNEEIQTIRHLPTKDISEYLMKARYSHRITQEFVESCKLGVVAICNGHIVPVNPMDDIENQVYLYNNIFFSRPVDVKESFKVSQGDEVSRKLAGHDLKNQKVLQSLSIDGLHTVLTTLVDYRGQRWIGQSVIPGILQANENAARLMYGILEDNTRFRCKTPALEVMREIGSKLSIGEKHIPAIPKSLTESQDTSKADSQNALLGFLANGDSQSQIIRVDDLDEVTELDSISVPHIGPLEGKILRGCDGRLYALEMTRLTPRDANYVKVNGTGKYDEEILSNVNDNVAVAYVLRDELIQSYKQTKTIQMRQEEMMTTLQKINEEHQLEEENKKKAKEIENNTTSDETKESTTDSTSETQTEEKAEFNPATKFFTPEVLQKINSIQMEFSLNPNVFLHTQSDIDESVVQADEQIARELAIFLFDQVLPNITEHIRIGEFAPYDGKALTEYLHNNGVNMRYLGELSRRAREEENIDRKNYLENQKRKNPMPFFWQDLLEVEIIARGMKHIINSYIGNHHNKVPIPEIIAHLFNLLLGSNGNNDKDSNQIESSTSNQDNKSNENKKKKSNKKNNSKGSNSNKPSGSLPKVSSSIPSSEHFNLSKEEFWNKYTEVVKSKFLHTNSSLVVASPVDSPNFKAGNPFILSVRLSKLSIVRRICQICGIRITCRDYDWSIASPFNENDIQDIVPLVKTCDPDAPVPEAKLFLEEAKVLLQQGNIGPAFERAQEASRFVSHVVGPVHPDTSRALSIMYSVLLRIGEVKSAVSTLSKKLTVDVQLYGLDSAETLQNHLNMSMIYQEIGNYLAAAAHIRSAVYILRLLCGDQHPEIANIYLRLAGIYNEVENHELAFKCLKIAKELVYLNGDQGTHALICQSMAGVYAQLDNFKDAIALQKDSYSILRQLFGEQDNRTADAKVRFEALIRKSVERNEQKAEKDKEERESSKNSLWLDDDFSSKSSKKSSNKGKKGKKK